MRNTDSMQIAVLYSKPSERLLSTPYAAADEDTAVIARMVVRGLEARGYIAKLQAIDEGQIEKISEIRADCIFNLIEWCGQDIGLSQKAFKYLRELKIPVTGSDEQLFVLTGDKIAMKDELSRLGIATPRSFRFVTGEEMFPNDLVYPIIVKPSLEHCSMGLSYETIAHSSKELRGIAKKQIAKFNQPALAEEFIVGREFLVYLIEEKGQVSVLPVEEIVFPKGKEIVFQTYETKWVEESRDYKETEVVVAKLSNKEKRIIEEECVKAFTQMKFRGYGRFDLRFRDGVLYILETNANPSVYDATDEIENIEEEVIPGMKYPDYLQKIVESAFWHYERGERV